MDNRTRLRIATITSLCVVVVVSIMSLAVVAIFTTRDLTTAERLVFIVVVMQALLGGLTLYVDRVRIRPIRGEIDESGISH